MSIPRSTTIAAALALILAAGPGHAEEPRSKGSTTAPSGNAKPRPKATAIPTAHRAHERAEEARKPHREQRVEREDDDHDRD